MQIVFKRPGCICKEYSGERSSVSSLPSGEGNMTWEQEDGGIRTFSGWWQEGSPVRGEMHIPPRDVYK